MKLTTTAFADGDAIGGEYAFCVPHPDSHVALGANKSPDLAWSGLPEGTESLALLCHDPVVPSAPDDVNQEGREVPPDLPRVDFYHWVMADIPPELGGFAAGEFSDGVTARGKDGPAGPHGTRLGINDYTNWFSGDADMEGDYYGYDGPCPPWNDSLVHEYRFTLFALDAASLELPERFTGADLHAAIDGHVLDEATVWGTYTQNPRLLG
jgi:Raf kinase inhibitor-like YbhB/YbcL family protein